MPTTIGFISDVHGDAHALRDALRLLDAMGVRQIVCLGDVFVAWCRRAPLYGPP